MWGFKFKDLVKNQENTLRPQGVEVQIMARNLLEKYWSHWLSVLVGLVGQFPRGLKQSSTKLTI